MNILTYFKLFLPLYPYFSFSVGRFSFDRHSSHTYLKKKAHTKFDFLCFVTYNPKAVFKFTTVKIIRAAVIAAVYSVLTVLVAPLSYGPLQIRFAEALTILPVLFPEAVIGVTAGCLISNIFSPATWLDVVFGTLATFAAAVLTYYIGRFFKRKAGVFLAALPPVLINAIVIPFVIFQYIQEDMANINIFTSNIVLLYLLGFTSILIGQAIAVYGIGIPFYYGVKKSMRL